MPEQKDALDKVVEKVVDNDKGKDPEDKVKQLEAEVAQLKAQNENLTQFLLAHIRFVEVIKNSIGNLPKIPVGRD